MLDAKVSKTHLRNWEFIQSHIKSRILDPNKDLDSAQCYKWPIYIIPEIAINWTTGF